MTNEVAVKGLDFSVDFKKSEIKVAHKAEFETAITSYAKKYEGLVIDPDNVEDARKVRAEMNKVKKGLDDKRKEIKKEFSQPLTEFENWIKEQNKQIQNVVSPIDEGIKEMDAREQKKRYDSMMIEITEIAPNYDVTIEELTINPAWANKGYFTTKGKLNKKALNEIIGEMKAVKAEKDQLEANKTLIANYAKAVGQEPESWVVQIENGATPQDLMKQIDQAIKAKNERLEQEQKEKEYEDAIAEMETSQIEVGNKVIDEETGEIVNTVDLPFGETETEEDPFADPFPVSRPAIKTVTYRLSAPNHLILQAKQYLQGLGIKIEEIE
ncbi:MAG: DUF1351 domain-containing protein [Enterococcus sp.]